MFKECVLFEQIPPGASAHSQAGVNIANNDEISATYTFRPSLRDWDGETLPGLGWGRGRPSRQIEAPAWTPAGVFWGQNSHCGLGRRWDGADGRGGIRILALDQGMKKTTMKPAWGRKIYFPKQFHLNDASDIHKFKEKAFLSETVLFLLLSAKAGTEEHIAKQVEKFINIKACYAFILPRWKGIFFKKAAYLSQTCFVNAQTRTRVGLFPQQPNSLAERQKDRVHLACHWGRRHRRQTKIPPFLSLATNRADGTPSPEVTKKAKRYVPTCVVFLDCRLSAVWPPLDAGDPTRKEDSLFPPVYTDLGGRTVTITTFSFPPLVEATMMVKLLLYSWAAAC